MRSLVEAAPLPDMYLNSAVGDRFVSVDVFLPQPRAVPYLSFIVFQWPCGRIHSLEFIPRHPGRSVMTDRLGLVSACALHQAQAGYLDYRQLADVHAVGEDQTVGTLFANGRYERSDDLHIALLEVALVGPHLRRLVDEVEAQVAVRNAFVAPRERFPVEDGGGQRPVAFGARSREQVGGFEFAAIDAVSRNAVKVQIDVNTVLAA